MNIQNIITEITPMLEQQGLESTWGSLLKTYAYHSALARGTPALHEHQDYACYDLLPVDYLKGLTLTQVGVLYEYSLACVDRHLRKSSGSYYTPEDVADFMALKASAFPLGQWVDPCAGVGNLSHALIKQQPDPERFLLENVTLYDINGFVLQVARTLLTILHYKNVPDLYDRLANNFYQHDFLSSDEDPSYYDYAILNPPYARAGKDDRFKTSSARDLYAFFLEKVIDESKGFVSITPQSYTHSSNFRALRELLIDEYNSLYVYNFDNVPDTIFKGIKYGSTNTNRANSVRASILVAKTGVHSDNQITPLVRWVSKSRPFLFTDVDTQLTPFVPTPELFPKLYQGTSALYAHLKNNYPTLKTLISDDETAYSLNIPTTPRYYITATEQHLERSSVAKLFFPNQENLNRAMILLNSSYMYWWWRVHDGGMGLTRNSILTLPVVPFDLGEGEGLLDLIRESERSNRVVKRNGGKDNENIKHPLVLIEKLTEFITARLPMPYNNRVIVEALSGTHDNDNISSRRI